VALVGTESVASHRFQGNAVATSRHHPKLLPRSMVVMTVAMPGVASTPPVLALILDGYNAVRLELDLFAGYSVTIADTFHLELLSGMTVPVPVASHSISIIMAELVIPDTSQRNLATSSLMNPEQIISCVNIRVMI